MSAASEKVQRRGPIERVKRSHEESYRHYRVIGGRQGGWHVAVAYEGPKQAFAATCPSLDEAIATVKDRIDQKRAEKKDTAIDALEYADYATGLNLSIARRTEAERHLLDRIGRLGETTLTRAQLRGHASIDDDGLKRGITQLGRRIARALDIRLPAGAANAPEARRILLKRDLGETEEPTFREPFVAAAKDHVGT